MKPNCPNMPTCFFVNTMRAKMLVNNHTDYIEKYCQGSFTAWSECTRYIVKNAINFCPDFVLPDSKMTPDEVITKFDEEME